VLVLNGEPKPLDWMAFTADSRLIASARKPHESVFRGIEFWDAVRGGPPVKVVPPDSTIDGFTLHPSGRWAYVTCWSRPDLSALDLDTGELYGLRCVAYGRHFPVAVSPDGGRVIASVHTHNYPRNKQPKRSNTEDWLICWSQPAGAKPRVVWERQRTIREPITYLIAFFPDSDRIATYESRHWGPRKQWRSQLAVRDASSGAYLRRADCEGAEALVVSPDGSQIVTRWGSVLSIWNANDIEATPRVIDEGRDPGWYSVSFNGPSIAFHPSGQYLAATSNDTTVKLYDTATWQLARTFTWNVGRLRSVAFSPDGTRAAVGSDTGKVVVWDVDLL
jgi:WD40 repeat protein